MNLGASKNRYVLNIDKGRVVSEEFAEGSDLEYVYLSEYTYSADGFLASRTTTHNGKYGTYDSKSTYSVSNENITGIDYQSTDIYSDEIYKSSSEYNITYTNKLNNLNVDLSLFLLDNELDGLPQLPLTGYYGKRIKNLPLSITRQSTREDTRNSETTTETSASVYNFTYTYNGDYPTKIVREKVGEYTNTYEISYDE